MNEEKGPMGYGELAYGWFAAIVIALSVVAILVAVLSGCVRQQSPAPTPQLTELTSGPQRAAVIGEGERETIIYMADRVSNATQLRNLRDWGITHVVMRLNLNTYSPDTPTEWTAELKKAEDLGLKIVVWPGDWRHPRTTCNYESPFPRTATGNIERLKPMLDFLVTHPAVVGVVTFHEAQYATNCPFATGEIVGIKNKIDAYTTEKGRRIPIWGYVGNLFGDPSYWTPEVIAGSMDIAVQWRACAGRAEGTCSSIPGRIINDRQTLVDAGLEDKIKTVFLVQSYRIEGSTTYGARLSLDEYKILFSAIDQTNAADGVGFYTWSADWWPDISEWPEMWSIVSWARNNAVNMPGQVPTVTEAPQTVTPVSTMFTSTPTAGKTSAPTKTRTPAPPIATRTPTPVLLTSTASPLTSTPVVGSSTPKPPTPTATSTLTPYCILLYPGPTPRVGFCP